EITALKNALGHVGGDDNQLNLLFSLGAAYEQSGQVPEAESTFEEIIARSPDYAPALNYLGYMLADRGERLDYARKLIEKAVEVKPDNPAYLDSYGWVLYRLGNFKDALKQLKKAVSLDSDPTIFDHLGDTYKALGNLSDARVWWQKALELSPDDPQLKEKLGN
ncbi:MAG TPA: tetratricopeptide repeat protein, partial [candidate division Zixibacteria bacterium]|nr:tetratricopeptide repeat protein [candidate division Zixibacteria bacterium]